MTTLVDIFDEHLPAVKAFLEQRPETSLFLLSNIRAFGPRRGQSLYSGNFKALFENGNVAAVFCLARNGGLVVQAAGRTDVAGAIVEAALSEALPIRGVLGEWETSSAVWMTLRAANLITETLASKEVLYRLDVARSGDAVDTSLAVRRLTPDDHDAWDSLSVAFQKEIGVPNMGDREQRKASFTRSAGLGHWWGGFEGTRLVSMTAIIALHERLAQIGAVFTVPDRRRCGFSRAVMQHVIRDSRLVHDLERLFLFTGETNAAARHLYESLGFDSFSYFGLFFGEPVQE